MKISTINILAGILSGIKINKIKDKDVKTALVNDFLHLRRFVKKAEEDRQEIVKKFQSDWSEELPLVEAFRRENKPVEGHKDYLEAENDANLSIMEIFNEDVETKLKPVPMDAFIDELGEDLITLEQIAILEECGILE